MNQSRQPQTGLVVLLVAIFLLLAPLPFLESPSEDNAVLCTDGLSHSVLRLGQGLAHAKLVNVPLEAPSEGKQRLKIDGVPYEVQIDQGMTRAEIEAVVNAVASQRGTELDRHASLVRFEGWEPSFLPIRIEYRHILVVVLVLILYAIYAFVGQRRGRNS